MSQRAGHYESRLCTHSGLMHMPQPWLSADGSGDLTHILWRYDL